MFLPASGLAEPVAHGWLRLRITSLKHLSQQSRAGQPWHVALSNLFHGDLICGSSHLPVTLYQSCLVDNERADASCQGCKGLLLCCCRWMWSLILHLVFHCCLTHTVLDTPAVYDREIKLCLTCICLLGFMKELK